MYMHQNLPAPQEAVEALVWMAALGISKGEPMETAVENAVRCRALSSIVLWREYEHQEKTPSLLGFYSWLIKQIQADPGLAAEVQNWKDFQERERLKAAAEEAAK